MSAFADNLRRIREAQGLKKSTIAKALGLSLPAYIYYEQGKREPGLTNIKKIADILGVSVNDLFEGVAEEKQAQYESARLLWTRIQFDIKEKQNGYILICPPNEHAEQLFPLEMTKADFVLLTNEIQKYIWDAPDAKSAFEVSACIVTSRNAALRRVNPHELVGRFVPLEYLPE